MQKFRERQKRSRKIRGSFEQENKKCTVDTDSDYAYNANSNEHYSSLFTVGQSLNAAMGESDSSLLDAPNVPINASNPIDCIVTQRTLNSIRGASSPQTNKGGKGMEPYVIRT